MKQHKPITFAPQKKFCSLAVIMSKVYLIVRISSIVVISQLLDV